MQEYSNKDLLLPATVLNSAVEPGAVNLGRVVLYNSTVLR